MGENKFKKFEIGTVFNKLDIQLPNKIQPKYSDVTIKYPSRLEAMAIDPSKISQNENSKYTAGQIVFPIKLFKKVNIKIRFDSEIYISSRTPRPALVKHAVEIMRKALNTEVGFEIDVEDETNLRHCGLGSSSSLISSVAVSINEVFGNPINEKSLIKYLAQNHGEEIDGDNSSIIPIQSIGGSASSGLTEGGIIIIAGENTVILNENIENDYDVVIGIPSDFEYPDSDFLIKKEEENMHKFIECGRNYGQLIAYRIFHECLPELKNGKLNKVGDLIYDYRFNMGSIKNCSFVYPKLNEIADRVKHLKENGICDVLSLSSVGPGFFALTKNKEIVCDIFEKEGLKTFTTKIHNEKYEVIDKSNESLEKIFWNNEKNIEYFSNKPADFRIISKLEKIINKKDLNVLDHGCGGGRHSEAVLKMGFNLKAIDINSEMISHTKLKIQKLGFKNVDSIVRRGSIIELPFDFQEFDIVISTGVLHQSKTLEEYKKAISEISRVLKNRGKILLNIFTNKLIEEDFEKIEGQEFTYKTKEGLIMTLLNKELFYEIMLNYNLILEEELIEEIKVENTGSRSVLRANFIKIKWYF